MLVFLLKSTACLTIFLAFYKLVLEKESIHHFKRFFLLGALMASFLIPNIVFTEYVDISPNTVNVLSPTTYGISEIDTSRTLFGASSFDWKVMLWSLYALGVMAFGFRFVAHLIQIWSRIRSNTKLKENFITKVLLKQSLPPHTFFNYIFLNQQQFEEKNIPQEVLLHEETHAKQRHSMDILFIELAQVLLWFNPIIYLFKSAIKLNHEFLADRAVINKNNDRSHYQNTILSYLSHDNFNKHQSIGIANAINYSSIKKRFTVMKTNTSKKSFVLRSFLLLPLTALLLFGFSEHRQIERDDSVDQIMELQENTTQSDLTTHNELAKNKQQQSASREEMKEYNALAKKYNNMDSNNMVINKKEVMRLKVIYGKMSEKQRADAEPFPNFPPPPPAPDATRPPMPPSALKSVKENKTTAPTLPPAPPVPPAPPKPIEHIKKMVAKGASFTLNGKEISGKKAIEVIQKNKHINIDAREANGINPIVKLSTEPIVIEN
ncbi:MAG: M56 family metallopeptidase [Bacteroidota bacterium]|uniref:M56 family metallopeptidase n=1 Tax=Flagellimonas profundi TaxID=2915620 RepID=A0ABS3FH18_9FLAO|nr:M56 family metallopeptidase [Allomuricauda profundi]MBO0342482.1 M56 family metallopeptidase [Allomuricauda profundi]MEC7770766.1 M56 family metallopeptidase [Bacteroidota bacterium]